MGDKTLKTITMKVPKASIMAAKLASGVVVSETSTEETPKVPVSVAAPNPTMADERLCRVGVALGYTHNAGNYTSARFDVSISIPCQHKEINAVYEFAKNWTDLRLQDLIAEMTKDAG